jgi:hypothetical protein
MAYIYGHYRESDGKLFYIGKGIGNRAWDKKRRNRYWFRVVNKHGLVVKIIEDNLTEEQAFSKEKQLIAEIGLENLANITEGGEGFTSEFCKQRYKDPEQRKKLSDIRKKKMEDPEFRKKMLSKLTGGILKISKEEWKKKVSEGQRLRYEQQELGEKTRELHKTLAKERWKNPEYRKNQLEARKNSPAFQEKLRLMREKATEKRKRKT